MQRCFGVTDGARTHDNLNHNQALCQLSYSHPKATFQRNVLRLRLWIYRRMTTGAGEEVRTLGLNHGKVALYQLSYTRIDINYMFGGE